MVQSFIHQPPVYYHRPGIILDIVDMEVEKTDQVSALWEF